MRKRLISFCLVFVFLAGTVPAAYASGGSLGNFRGVNTYADGQFSDVAAGAWYAGNVASAYELGLMKGGSDGRFDPDGNVTVAEAVTMAARLYSIYMTGTESFAQTSPWYQVYVDYDTKNGIITDGEFTDYTAAATRLQFASVFASALPDEALTAKNTVADGAIPDTDSAAVYKLYRAGILTGNDTSGTFAPGSAITRAEASVIVARMADETLRRAVALKTAKTELTAEQIYAQCSPAVFYIVVSDKSGTPYASGSGFFISGDGTAVTNYHVIKNAYSADITLIGGDKTYKVLGVCDYSEDEDWAVLKIDGSGFSYLDIGDASTVVGGATVYAIGNPLGMQGTISQGLISNPSREIGGTAYIQTSAAISSGSSGGALINKYGEVIGITTASLVDGQNLNLAVPVSEVKTAGSDSLTTLQTLSEQSGMAFYAGFYPAVDFGAYFGVPLYHKYIDSSSAYATYYYDLADIPESVRLNDYLDLLTENGFYFSYYLTDDDGYTVLVYENSACGMAVYVGGAEYGDAACLCIMTEWE